MERYNELIKKYLARAREKWDDFDEKLKQSMAESACPEENYVPSLLEDIVGYLSLCNEIDNYIALFNVIMIVTDCDENLTIENKCEILEIEYDRVFRM